MPALAKKLVEVEYMMLGKDMPAGASLNRLAIDSKIPDSRLV